MNLQQIDTLYRTLSMQTRLYLQDVTNEFPFIVGFHGDIKLFADMIEIFCEHGDPPIVLRKPARIVSQSDEVYILGFRKLVARTNDELLLMRRKKSYDPHRIEAIREMFMHYCYGKML